MQPKMDRTASRILSGLLSLLFLFSAACGSRSDSLRTAYTSDRLSGRPTPVLMISIDGFRHDYLDLYQPPNLLTLAAEGARAERLVPSFPSKTFPNHYTLVTGLVPDRNGIVSNNMVDAELGRFSLSNRDAVSDGRWWQGEPVWNTAQRQGLPAAAMFWPGSEAAIGGMRPTFWVAYDGSISGPDRLQRITDWLSLPEAEKPRFLTLYFSILDDAGHDHGPYSHEAQEAVLEVDRLIGDLRHSLEAMNQPVHWVIVSDHGMAETTPERVIMIDDFVDLNDTEVIDKSPVLAIAPKSGPPTEEWIERSVAALSRSPHLEAYRKEDLPKRLDHGHNPRVAPVLAIADEGWRFAVRSQEARRPQIGTAGQHGYDPSVDSMGALLIFAGPRIRTTSLGPINNVDIYSLVCELLEITPAPNDGSLDSLAPALIPSSKR